MVDNPELKLKVVRFTQKNWSIIDYASAVSSLRTCDFIKNASIEKAWDVLKKAGMQIPLNFYEGKLEEKSKG